ncbi:hypothetical protein [Polaromonas aquatica]|uniref:Uncharacterized protein n=1 Tax=Polaromonas aquatica TaxID=332657 RepID=A0ABW1TWT2_9BURK
MHRRLPPTNTLLTRAKRQAKKSTTPDKPYTLALDEQAQLAGYPDWRTLALSNGLRNAQEGDEIPLDPVLPPNFDNTPNEDRSEKELDKWWDKPFIVSRGDGTFEARALNGGAWDRSSHLGIADSVDAARELAKKKQEEWIKITSEPITCMRSDGLIDLVIMARRPDLGNTVLASALRREDVEGALAKLKVSAGGDGRAAAGD